MHGKRRGAKISPQTLPIGHSILHVREVGCDLDDVMHVRAVRGKHALDLIKGVFALRDKIVVMADVTAWAVLILCTDPGKEDKLARAKPLHGNGFGEYPFRPGAVSEFLLLVPRRGRLLRRGGSCETARMAAAISERIFCTRPSMCYSKGLKFRG